MKKESQEFGIGMFTALAMIVSYSINKSIIWAFVHGLFGILYLLYAYFSGQLG